jgi:hypothetical protein
MGDITGGPGGTSTTLALPPCFFAIGDHAVAHRHGDLVALPAAVLLVDQVHLDVAHAPARCAGSTGAPGR